MGPSVSAYRYHFNCFALVGYTELSSGIFCRVLEIVPGHKMVSIKEGSWVAVTENNRTPHHFMGMRSGGEGTLLCRRGALLLDAHI